MTTSSANIAKYDTQVKIAYWPSTSSFTCENIFPTSAGDLSNIHTIQLSPIHLIIIIINIISVYQTNEYIYDMG